MREHSDLALFLAFQQMRTPAVRDTTQWLASFHCTLTIRRSLENLDVARREYQDKTGREISKEELRRMRDGLDSGGLSIEPHEDAWIAVVMPTALKVAELISSLEWRVVDAPAGVVLPTSDDPLVIAKRYVGTGRYRLGGGWLEPNVEGTLTLSPSCVLVLSQSLDQFPDIGTDDWFSELCKRTVSHAQRWVFSSEPSEAISSILASSRAPTPVIDVDGGQYATRGIPNEVVRELMVRRGADRELMRFGPRVG